MEFANRFTVTQLKAKLGERKLATTGTKPQLIARLMGVDPDGTWANDEKIGNDEEQHEDQIQLDRDRKNLLRQELEVMRRERDVAQQEAVIARRELELANVGNPAMIQPGDGNLPIHLCCQRYRSIIR